MLALIQISESILMIVFCLLLVKGFTKKRIKILAVPAQILMSFTSLGGIFFLQVYTFVHISGLNFGLLAGYFAAGITLITICSLWVVKAFFPSWELRVEFKIILAVVQIVLAMFLPIIVNKIKIPYSIITVDVLSIAVLLVTVIFFSLIGAMLFFKRQAQSYD